MSTAFADLLQRRERAAALSKWQHRVRGGAWTLLVVSAIASAGMAGWHIRRQRNAELTARQAARRGAVESVKSVEAELQRVQPIVTDLARSLSAGDLTPGDLPARMASELTQHPEAFEIGVAYVPFATDPRVRLFAPHAARDNGKVVVSQLEQRLDYTTAAWYTDGLASPAWGEPYFAAARTLVAGYSEPFSRPGDPSKTAIGLVRVNIPLDHIQSIVSNVSVGKTGYGYLFSSKGTYIAHQNLDYVRLQRTSYELARAVTDDTRDTRLANLDRVVKNRESTEQLVFSFVTGQASWLFNEPFKLNGWVMSTIAFKDEIGFDAIDVRHAAVQVLGCVLVFLFAASMLLFRVHLGEHRELWSTALSAALLLLAGVTGMWILTLRYPDRNGEESVHIVDAPGLRKFVESNVQRVAGQAVAPVQLSAGVLIRTMRIIDANNIVLTGTAWEKIPSARRADVRPGLGMPDAESLEWLQTTTVTQGANDVVGWNFKATLREPSEWSQKYPFDRALIRVRLVALASSVPVVLVPDLAGYKLLTPAALPGIEKGLVLPGWMLDHSYFSFIPQSTSVNTAAVALQNALLPYDLSFNLVTQRRFLDPFISSVLPIVVIMCLLFGLLVVGSKVSSKVAATGFNATEILGASVALLFPALIAQVNLRSKIGATEIIYIEYFYFILYTAILGVAANALTFTLAGSGVAQVRDNLIPKLMFWPLVLGACFAVTVVFLY